MFQIDVIWPGILASHFIDLAEHIARGADRQHFPAIVENNTVDGALVAMPWFTDAGILYYRSDLLEKYGKQPPATWQELTEIAKEIQDGERADGNDKMLGFVFQAKAYEGLTCDALEWIDSFGGGTIVAEDGSITINNEKAAEALDLAATWIGDDRARGRAELLRGGGARRVPVRQRRVHAQLALCLGARQCRRQRGQGQDRASRRCPRAATDGKHTGALGGWQLAVSKYSPNAEIAADLVAYLTSYDEQKRRAIEGSYNPTIAELYEDQEVLAAVPVLRRAVRDLRQRGGAALQGHRRQVQPGQLGVLQCRARRPERQGRAAPTGWLSSRARSTGCRAAGAGSRAPGARALQHRSEGSAKASTGVADQGARHEHGDCRRKGQPLRSRKKPRRLTRERIRSAWLFMAPMLIVLALVAGWPLLRTMWFGFTDANLVGSSGRRVHRLRQLLLPADRSRLVERGLEHPGVHGVSLTLETISAWRSRSRSTPISAAAACCAPPC